MCDGILAARLAGAGTGGAPLAPLASRDYRRFWAGAAVSQAGDHFHSVAPAIVALDLAGSATRLGTVLTIQVIGRTLLMLVGGVATDRV